jgi:pyruvate,water dikinase
VFAGAARASEVIREVRASVWSWRAFEERGFWGIDHGAVRMAVLALVSFPDEQANGVLITQYTADPNVGGLYVNVQKGETPVTNPGGGLLPEVVSIVPAPAGFQVARLRYSTLSPGVVLLSDAELGALVYAAMQNQAHFAPLYAQDPGTFALDREFRFHGKARSLYIKQVRPFTTVTGP